MSLARQSYQHYELIVVDQNEDDRVEHILSSITLTKAIHLRSPVGASIARNFGLDHATGDVIGFPDDDCMYPDSLLADVAERLDNQDIDGLSISIDGTRDPIPRRSLLLSPITTRGRVGTQRVFIKRKALSGVRFDPRFGPGSRFGLVGGEDVDLVLSCIEQGARILYDPSLWLIHPSREPQWTEATWKRAYAYGYGDGAVMRKHTLPLPYVAWQLADSWLRVAISLALFRPARAALHYYGFLGKWNGYFHWPKIARLM